MTREMTHTSSQHSAISSASIAAVLAALAAFYPALRAGAQVATPARPTINITAYTIDAEIRPKDHTLEATARVTFTPLEDLPTAIFDFNGALQVDKVTDPSGAALNGTKGPDATLVVTPQTV
jgi:hypothetical protein